MSNYIGAFSLAAGAGLLAYCVYFDRKRRNDPDYRDKVTARREREREARARQDDIVIPNPADKQAVEKFFVKQIELGEELIQSDVDKAVMHLSYAITFCPRPENLIQYFREILPSDAYAKLVEMVPETNRKVFAETQKITEIKEEDVE